MTILKHTRYLLLTAMSAAMCGVCGSATASDAQLENFLAEDGQAYFALTMPPVESSADAPRDVVVLFDTSASQAGFYRDTAIAALEKCLASLQEGDRVQVVAVDLAARPMNDVLAPASSKVVAEAVEALRREPPLGSTDMELALRSASDLFDAEANQSRTVVYIGDGMSPANLLETNTFGELVSDLRRSGVSVNSFAVGPQRDTQLLAALANQTGGNLYIDTETTWPNEAEGITTQRALEENRRRGGVAGKMLAQWVRGEVVRPTTTEWPAVVAEAYPTQMPPLRSDRETVVVGKWVAGADTQGMAIATQTGGASHLAGRRGPCVDGSFLPAAISRTGRAGRWAIAHHAW